MELLKLGGQTYYRVPHTLWHRHWVSRNDSANSSQTQRLLICKQTGRQTFAPEKNRSDETWQFCRLHA